MRLVNAKTLALEEFQDNNIPRYAILSHTWGEDEMSFEDMQKWVRSKQRRCYIKIRFACQQACKDDFSYVWVDTCCKENHVLYTCSLETSAS